MRYEVDVEAKLRQSQLAKSCYVSSSPDERQWLRSAVSAGEVLNPMGTLYVRAEYWQQLTEPERVLHCMRAMQREEPETIFAAFSAALVWGLPVPESKLWPIRVLTDKGNSARGNRHVFHQSADSDASVLRDHLRVTSLARTSFDCMRELDFDDGLAVANATLDMGGWTRDELTELFNDKRKSSRGGPHVMEILQYAGTGRDVAAQVELQYADPWVPKPLRHLGQLLSRG